MIDRTVPSASHDTARLPRFFHTVLCWRYLILLVVGGWASVAALSVPFNDDWPWAFVNGSRLLFGDHPRGARAPGGFHLYANYDQIKMGPLTLVLVRLLRVFGADGSRVAAIVLMTAAGPLLVFFLERASAALEGDSPMAVVRRRVIALLGGVIVVIAWAELAAAAVHLDDALALLFATAALGAAAAGRPAWAGTCVGLAVASKPWAAVLLPLLVFFTGRRRLSAFGAALAVMTVTWLPFVLVDKHTLNSHEPYLFVDSRSVLALFGVDPSSRPDWIRSAQLVLALIVGSLCASTRRWGAVLLIGVAIRVMLDPAVVGYYSTGLVVAALAWELLTLHRPTPFLTAVTYSLLLLIDLPIEQERLQALLRLVACGAAIVAGLALPTKSRQLPTGRTPS